MLQSEVVEAITVRQVIAFDYDGHPREVIPAAIGVSSTGKVVLRGYQIGGTSSSGTLPEWRLFSLAKVSGGRTTGQAFSANPPDYERDDRGMTTIFAQL